MLFAQVGLRDFLFWSGGFSIRIVCDFCIASELWDLIRVKGRRVLQPGGFGLKRLWVKWFGL